LKNNATERLWIGKGFIDFWVTPPVRIHPDSQDVQQAICPGYNRCARVVAQPVRLAAVLYSASSIQQLVAIPVSEKDFHG
jgi:hypothetical protein